MIVHPLTDAELARRTDLLGERGYEGNPLRAHEPAHSRTPFTDALFDRWLDLFDSTIDEQFAGPTAELAKSRATKMAQAMRRVLTGRHGAPAEAIEPKWTTDAGSQQRLAR